MLVRAFLVLLALYIGCVALVTYAPLTDLGGRVVGIVLYATLLLGFPALLIWGLYRLVVPHRRSRA